MRTHAAAFVLASAVLALAAAAPATGGGPQTLSASVGPGFTIKLLSHGLPVKSLAPTTYNIEVADKSPIHNFHLIGPGVNKSTSVAGTGRSAWRVFLKQGTYRYVCDPHAASMKGKFIVRTP